MWLMAVEELLAGYHRFKRDIADDLPELERLAIEGQTPTTLWIGCSDSRVVPELITDASPGDLFVLRNVANIVPPHGHDDTVGAVIEYAVLHLQVAQIVLSGHTECGGIKALAGQLDVEVEPHLAQWIELARPALERATTEVLPEPSDEDVLLARIRANVLLQREHLMTYPCVRTRVADGLLVVFACVYDIRSGDVEVFNVTLGEWVLLPD
jgi:carbonic anhydrase